MSDQFQNRSTSYTGPATKARQITPSDINDLQDIPRWLVVDGGGAVTIDMMDNDPADNPISLTVDAGQVIFVRPSRVYSTGTTATGIKGYW